MAILYDARGNEYQGELDQIGGGTVTDARSAGATLSALNAEVVMDLNGKSVATYDIRSAANSASYVFEGTIDGTNYVSMSASCQRGLLAAVVLDESLVSTLVVATTVAAVFQVDCSGFRRVRCRVSAFTSGSAVVTGRASIADHLIYVKQIPSLLHVTATAAANTQATATLPAAAAGLFHYITNINLMRNATAALAGTATLIHTTTNLPGSPAWSVGNAMIAGGTQIDLDYTPATPLRSSAAATNTTIVMPAAGAAVLNRINVTYYVGS